MSDELTYRRAGVDIDEQNRAIRMFAPAVQETHDARVLGGPGTFGALFDISALDVEEPVLVSSMDGVGTKTCVAAQANQFSGLGADIVNHCVNDILAQGARPLFFLDYFAASRLNAQQVADVVTSAAQACKENDCALVGGEIAEMPDVYRDGQIDIVGAIVGVVSKPAMLPTTGVGPGDLVVGLASDGLHTNGYTLARRALLDVGGLRLEDTVPELGRSLAEELLRPHRSYFPALRGLLGAEGRIKAIAHITGGGFYENLPRVFPPTVRAIIEKRQWTPPPIFQMIQTLGAISDTEMYRTFNMGIGMVLIAASDAVPALVQQVNESGITAYVIGELTSGGHDVVIA